MTVPRGPKLSRVASSTSSDGGDRSQETGDRRDATSPVSSLLSPVSRVVILRFLDADSDPVYVRADAILGVSVGFADRLDETGKRVRVTGTIIHLPSGPLPVYDDYERVLELWLAATGSELLMEPADHELHFRFTEPAP